ncbi:MAG: LamG-like jellyroll fold domain-containing protein [Victivallaceae bacterium]|jgi:hypothetical protein
MRKIKSAMIMALTGIIAGPLFHATLSAYTINGSTITLTASDRSASDNTSLIQGCLNNPSTSPAPAGYNFSKIIIQPGTGNASWPVCPLFFNHDSTEIHLDANTVLEAKTGGYPNGTNCVLRATQLSNIKVTGDTGAKILMHKEEYALLATAEWRTAISFYACSNVTVSGLTLANTGGDGISLYSASEVPDANTYCSNVAITNVVVDGAARNGLAAVSVDGLTVTGCTFKNTQGQGNAAAGGPWAGIDLEPDYPTQILKNIVIDNCSFLNNRRRGLLLHAIKLNGSTQILNITVQNCIMQNNGWYGIQVSYVPASLSDSSSVVFQDCIISDNKLLGVCVYNKARDAGTLSFTNCYLKNNNLTGYSPEPVNVYDQTAFVIYNLLGTTEVGGNIQLNNIVVEQPTNRSVSHFLQIDGTDDALIDNVSGTIYASCGTLSTVNTTNINVTTASNAAQSYWKLDETGGSVANDSSGNCDGTLLNSPAWAIGRIGGGLTLNGTTQLVSVANDASLNIGTGDFSISLWMQRSDYDVPNKRLLYKGAQTDSEIGYALSGSNTVLALVLCNGGTRIIPGLGQWHHMVFTVDRASGKARSYLDGVYQAEMNISAFSGVDISNTRNLLIGAAAIDGTLAWPGKVDDVRICKRVLTAGEIADLASSASACWRLDEGSGSGATDSIGRSSGMLQNSPAWTTGKLGGALALNGVNQFVSVSNNSSDLNIGTGDFSVSLWMQRGDDAVTNKRLLYKGAQADSEIGYALAGSNTVLNLLISNGVTRISTNCSIPGLNQWHHVVFTVDRASGNAKLYMNGVYQAEMNISSYNGADISNTRDLLIGAANAAGLAWPGKVDDVRIYKRVLSTDEVLQLYSATP